MKTRLLLAGIGMSLGFTLSAAPFSESTFTEIVKDVTVIAAANRQAAPAQVSAIVKAPDLVRTGPESRAELTAPDKTITRIGANTVFSFEPVERNLRLEKGSVLFHSPSGKGGGTIKTGGATAAVLGTTIIVAATPDGGFKAIVLEGKATATLPSGKALTLKAGQIVFILPGDKGFSNVLDINLEKLVGGSSLVNGFTTPLASLPLIQAAIAQQNHFLASGKAEDTGIPPNIFLSQGRIGNGANALDNNTYSTLVFPFIRQAGK
jgi:hypothetical protein